MSHEEIDIIVEATTKVPLGYHCISIGTRCSNIKYLVYSKEATCKIFNKVLYVEEELKVAKCVDCMNATRKAEREKEK